MNDKKNYLKGDYSFKKWFSIMWKNWYIQMFTGILIIIGIQIFNWSSMVDMVDENFYDSTFGGIIATFTMFLPLLMLSLIIYKGFIQFWSDLKNGNSR